MAEKRPGNDDAMGSLYNIEKEFRIQLTECGRSKAGRANAAAARTNGEEVEVIMTRAI